MELGQRFPGFQMTYQFGHLLARVIKRVACAWFGPTPCDTDAGNTVGVVLMKWIAGHGNAAKLSFHNGVFGIVIFFFNVCFDGLFVLAFLQKML